MTGSCGRVGGSHIPQEEEPKTSDFITLPTQAPGMAPGGRGLPKDGLGP